MWAVRHHDWVFVKQLLDDFALHPDLIVTEVVGGKQGILAMETTDDAEWIGSGTWQVLIQYGADRRAMACGLSEQQQELIYRMHRKYGRNVQRHPFDCDGEEAAASRADGRRPTW